MKWARGFIWLWIVLTLVWGTFTLSQKSFDWSEDRNWVIISELCTQFTATSENALHSLELDEILETGRQEKYRYALKVSVPDVIACERANRFKANLIVAREVGSYLFGMIVLPSLVVLLVGMVIGITVDWVISAYRARRLI